MKKSYVFLIFLLSVAFFFTACGGDGGGGGGNTNTPPVANAGHDMNALKNALIVLDGSTSSDADGDPLAFNWTIVSKPVGSSATLANPSNVAPTFTTDLSGIYTASLVVSDGIDNSIEDTVSITALESVSHIRDTGQTQCYNNEAEITCPNSGDAFYGQDAHYSTNPLRFVDNGSVVTDSINDLMWQKADDGSKYNWYQAMGIFDATYNPGSTDVCGSLSLGGYSDWRLPSRRELVSVLNYIQDEADTTYFQSSGSDYWSSTTSVVSSDVAWWLMGNRVIYGSGGDSALYVRCVRGSSWGQNSFVDNGDGTVTDNMSGLIWQQYDDGVARNWEEALAYCEGLTFAGSSDWRLPDIKELESLVYINSSNETPFLPAIDSTYFPTTQTDKYWSSTSDYYSTWIVDFATGWVDREDKASFKFSRCLR